MIAFALGLGYVPCERHHLTVGGKHGAKRRGQGFVVGLNTWSHRGEPFGGRTAEQCEALFGPSYAKNPRAFREKYPDEVLLELQERLLGSAA